MASGAPRIRDVELVQMVADLITPRWETAPAYWYNEPSPPGEDGRGLRSTHDGRDNRVVSTWSAPASIAVPVETIEFTAKV